MRIIFTVTNDLNYDGRMIRICTSLSNAGYRVTLVGTRYKSTEPLQQQNYKQKRIRVHAQKGFAFYFLYNLKLFFYLLFRKSDILCCIDLDTMLPVYFTSMLKRKTRVYDAHEYFSQQKEIITRPKIYRFWHFIEKTFVPKFKNGYSVSQGITEVFTKNYGVRYAVIRNMPPLKTLSVKAPGAKNIIYRGSVNEGRGFEYLIPAMKSVNAKLIICGNGNFFEQAKQLVFENELQHKIEFRGRVFPSELDAITADSYLGLNLIEMVGHNQYLSLANKFFDYIQNAIPQLTMNFPEYKKINDEFEVAVLMDDLSENSISTSLNHLLEDEKLYSRLQENCLEARQVYNWQNEEKKLLDFYNQLKT
jgi:glycosyltransferase involved in cell wall biosynthesis